jgi:hypothetical protein
MGSQQIGLVTFKIRATLDSLFSLSPDAATRLIGLFIPWCDWSGVIVDSPSQRNAQTCVAANMIDFIIFMIFIILGFICLSLLIILYSLS